MTPAELQTGDIIAFRYPDHFLQRGIRAFLWLWSLIHYREKPKAQLYNHTMICYQPGKVAEAVKEGYVRRNFIEHHGQHLNRAIVFRLQEPLTEAEQQKVLRKSCELANKNIEYEFLNFLWWMVYILSNGKWDLSPKGAARHKRLFCFEVSALLLNEARPGFFAQPDKVNTVDLQHDLRFKQLYFN